MKEREITIAYGLVGWALCGAAMGLVTAITTLSRALVIHAIAAPLIFSVISMVHSRTLRSWAPVKTAAVFTAVVILMDAFVVALAIERSFQMFASPLGTWIPFALIFLSSWMTEVVASRSRRR